jgi:hypothetical protein
MRFEIWNVRSFYRSGSLKTAVSKLAKYKVYLVGYNSSDGIRVAMEQLEITHFSMKMGMLITI